MAATTNQFSAVLLGDLNDFLAPAQACVNPVFASGPPAPAAATTPAPAASGTIAKKRVELEFDDAWAASVGPVAPPPHRSKKPGVIKFNQEKKVAQVSLSDCLACSGCVTSAETVLLKQQSVSEFLACMQAIRDGSHASFRMAVVSVSPQVRASLAVRFAVSPHEAFARVSAFLRAYCGVEFVCDLGELAADMSQMEVARTFVARYRDAVATASGSKLPVLSSACPGFVCYAEKTHPHLLPYLSEVKSPQQIGGALVKRFLGESPSHQLRPEQVYHVTVMQCPDKKLEGSRREFYIDSQNPLSAEVNCVLTATELCDVIVEVMASTGQSLDDAFHALGSIASTTVPAPALLGGQANVTGEEPNAGSSGSLCAYVFRYACRELFGVRLPPNEPLPFKPGRNPDTWSVELEVDDRVVLRFGASYGFRNIQDTVRKMKSVGTRSNNNNNNKEPFLHFVEVMACPGGCSNGGGLIMPSSSSAGVSSAQKRTHAELVSQAMRSIPFRPPEENQVATGLLGTALASGEARTLLHTTFNNVKDTSFTNTEQGAMMQGW